MKALRGSSKGIAKHIVYGRKWRVEPNLPSSEIIQTCLLALKKAREHEIRELFALKSSFYNATSTPFSGHSDIPLIVRTLNHENDQPRHADIAGFRKKVERLVKRLTFDRCGLRIANWEPISNQRVILEIEFTIPSEIYTADFPELVNAKCTVLISELSINEVLHKILAQLIALSDNFVDKHFKYQGFARFRNSQCLEKIGDISILTRSLSDVENYSFEETLKHQNYTVDSTRAPKLEDNQWSRRVMASLNWLKGISGHHPTIKKSGS
ncbi:MAG: hypothetical protein AAF197_07435 [Pseudomonadota bacterium]